MALPVRLTSNNQSQFVMLALTSQQSQRIDRECHVFFAFESVDG
jgi:hypothetical protein